MKALRLVSQLPRDSSEQWKSYIDEVASNPNPHFLTVKSVQYEDRGDLIIATLDFVEKGEKISEYLQRRAKTGWKSGAEIGQFLLDVVETCEKAESYLGANQLSTEMLYRLESGELRIAPFLHDGYEESGRLADLLQLVISIPTNCSPAAAAVLSSVPEKARECTQAQLRQWLSEQLPLLATEDENQRAAESTQKCARCGSEVHSSVCKNCIRAHVQLKSKGRFSTAKALPLEDTDELQFPEEADEFVVCIACKKPAKMILFNCRIHGFCSFICQGIYLDGLSSFRLDFGSACFICVTYEEQQAANFPQLQGLVSSIAEIKNNLHEGNKQVAINLKLALGQLDSILESMVQEGQPWPAVLVPRYIHQSCYLLRCCVCNANVLVPRWRPEELALCEEVPFLVMCEWRTHAVCSAQCWRALRQSGRCTVCKDSQLKLRLVEQCPEHSHPTLEAVKRIPGTMCVHSTKRDTMPYLSCSHEVCVSCLTEELFEMNKMKVKCTVCYTSTDAEIVRKAAFS